MAENFIVTTQGCYYLAQEEEVKLYSIKLYDEPVEEGDIDSSWTDEYKELYSCKIEKIEKLEDDKVQIIGTSDKEIEDTEKIQTIIIMTENYPFAFCTKEAICGEVKDSPKKIVLNIAVDNQDIADRLVVGEENEDERAER